MDFEKKEGSPDASRMVVALETGRAGRPPAGKIEKAKKPTDPGETQPPGREEEVVEAPRRSPATGTAPLEAEAPAAKGETLQKPAPVLLEPAMSSEELTASAPPESPSAESRHDPALPSSSSAGITPAEPDKASGSNGEPRADAEPVVARFGSRNGPKVVRMTSPEYPFRARRLHKEGRVLIELHIDAAGKVKKAEVVDSAGYGFDESALKAVEESRFLPATRDGEPVPCQALLPVRFTLKQRP
jgi:protein TonB